MGPHRKALKAMFERDKWKILRGDTVMILAGRDKGQLGTVRKVIRDPKYPRVLVEGRNLNKKHVKRNAEEQTGGIINIEAPIHYSNVSLVAQNNTGKQVPVRAAWAWLEDGSKVRVARGKDVPEAVIVKPAAVLSNTKPTRTAAGPRDTPYTLATAATYSPAEQPAPLSEAIVQRLTELAVGDTREDKLTKLGHTTRHRRTALWGWQGFAAAGKTGQPSRQ